MELVPEEYDAPYIPDENRNIMRRIFINKGEFIKPGGERNLEPVTELLRDVIWTIMVRFLDDPYLPSMEEM